jgi:hypothetical protein
VYRRRAAASTRALNRASVKRDTWESNERMEKIMLTKNRNLGSMRSMKTKTLVVTLALCFAAGALCFASSTMMMGTWKLNEAKSKIAAGMGKNDTVVYEAAGDSVKVTVDGTDADGKSTHNEWTGKFDGKDYPVTGDPTSDMRSYKKINDHTMKLTNKKDGKVTMSGRIVVSADGKTRTVTISGTDAKGKKFKSMSEYDRQ